MLHHGLHQLPEPAWERHSTLRGETLLNCQRDLVRVVAASATLERALEGICRVIEEHAPDVRACVAWNSPDGRWHAVGPTIPELKRGFARHRVLETRTTFESLLSSAACFTCSDIATDLGFGEPWKSILLGADVRALSSTPIGLTGAPVRGVILLCMSSARAPQPGEGHLAGLAADTALLALQRADAAVTAGSGAPAGRDISAVPAGLYATGPGGIVTDDRYRAVVESLAELVCRFRPDGTILFVNNAYARSRNTTAESLIGASLWEFVPESEHAAIRAQIARITPGSPEVVIENKFETDQGVRWFLWTNRAVEFDREGRPVHLQSTGVDITERKLNEERLRESQKRFRQLADTMPQLVWIAENDGSVTYCNSQAVRYAGIEQQPGVEPRWNWLRVIHPADLEASMAAWNVAVATGCTYECKHRMKMADGEFRWHLSRACPVVTAERRQWYGTATDVHDLKQTETALRDREAHLTLTTQAASIGTWQWSIVPNTVLWSAIHKQMWGYEAVPGVLAYDDWTRLILPEDLQRVEQAVSNCLTGQTDYDVEYRITPKGSNDWRWIRSTGKAEFDAGGRPVMMLGVSMDITQRKLAEESLRDSEERFRMLADNIAQFAWMADATGWILWYNRRWYDFTGTTYEQVRGWGWTKVHHPEHVNRVVRKFQHCCDAGEDWEDVFPLRGKDGNYRWFLSRALPIRDETGNIVRWFGTNTDITERRALQEELERHKAMLEQHVEERTRELMATYERLRLSERMAMLGTLSTGVGHDLGNLLVPMRVRLESLALETMSEQARDDLRAIGNCAEYLRRLAEGLRLLALDPQRASRDEVTDLAGWWADAHGVFQSVLPRGISLIAGSESVPARATVSKAALTQVVFNLVQNAGDAMRERGSGRVAVSWRREDAVIAVEVADDGPGMTPEVRSRCMEPFFTTKQRGISTGLGLALVYNLVRESGGTVDLETEPGAGTKFTIRFAAAAEVSRDTQQSRSAVIDVKDARLSSYVTSELRSLQFNLKASDPAIQADLFVLDNPERLASIPAQTPVIYVGDLPQAAANVQVLGNKPGVMAVRDALREIGRRLPSADASRTAS